MHNYVQVQAKLVLPFEQIHQQFVEAMLQLHKKYSNMVRETFSNDQQFIAVLDKACAAVINHKPAQQKFCKSPELVSLLISTIHVYINEIQCFLAYDYSVKASLKLMITTWT